MDAHARSLLERLNTSSSPKPLPKPSVTPDTKNAVAASPLESKDMGKTAQEAPISPQTQRPTHATVEQPEATMSVKDLLVSARHRSRETSVAPSSHSTEDTHPTESSSSETVTQQNVSRLHPLSAKDDRHIVSDGDSSANPEEIPTPPGSNHSSLVSNDTDNSRDAPTPTVSSPSRGHRITNDVPSVVTLSPMRVLIPRLQITTDPSGRTFPGDGIEQIANLARSFGLHDRDIIGATTKYIVYALKDGRIRIIDQNTGTRAIAETPSASAIISLTIQDGPDSEESLLLVLDLSHELTIWSIKPWKVDSADVPLDYLARLQTTGGKVDQSFPPIAKWWPRYANCLAVCTGLAVRIYVLVDTEAGKVLDISEGREHAISIPVDTGVRDFSFSADGSALAVVDYHGDILLWALCSDPTFAEFYDTSRLKSKLTLSKPTITYALPSDLNPCSIQFLDLGDETSSAPFTPLLLVGSSYNRRLHLIDIGQGTVLQEIVLPSIGSASMPAQNFSMTYTKEKQFLTVGDTISNSIFFFHLYSAPTKGESAASQSEYLVHVAERKSPSKSSVSKSHSFDYVTELPFFPNTRLQTLAVTTSVDAFLDVFTAHSNGFTMLSPELTDVLPPNYLKSKTFASTKPIGNPELDRVLEPFSSVDSSPSPCSSSPRSSFESVRSGRAKSPPVVVKKESEESLRASPAKEQHSPPSPPLKSVEEVRRGVEVATVEMPLKPHVSEKARSPSPVAQALPPRQTLPPPSEEVGSIGKDLETSLTQALEQQFQRLVDEQKQNTAMADDRHESILKVVSSTLTTNVGKLLEQTVRTTVEKSILPTINTTVRKSIDQQLAKTLATPLEKFLPTQLRTAVNDAVQKILFDGDGGVKFSETISKAVVAKLETSLQKDLSSRLGTMFEKSLGPMVNKLEERMHASIDKGMQRIQKENRASQQEMAKKIDALTATVTKISEHVKKESEKAVPGTKSPASTPAPVFAKKQTMANQFKAGTISAAIETWSDSTDAEQAALFEVCLDHAPSVLSTVDQISLMSAMNAISIDLKTHLEPRLAWLEKIINLAKKEGRYTEYWPRVLALLDQRLDVVFEETSSKNPKSPLARKIAITQYYTQNKLTEMKQQ